MSKINKFYGKIGQGKLMLELIAPEMIEGLGKVLTGGAVKHGARDWENYVCGDLAAYEEFKEYRKGSMLRHAIAYDKGIQIDPESGIHHMYHLATNALILAVIDERRNDNEFGDQLIAAIEEAVEISEATERQQKARKGKTNVDGLAPAQAEIRGIGRATKVPVKKKGGKKAHKKQLDEHMKRQHEREIFFQDDDIHLWPPIGE